MVNLKKSIDALKELVKGIFGSNRRSMRIFRYLLIGGGIFWPLGYWSMYLIYKIDSQVFFWSGILLTMAAFVYDSAWQWLIKKELAADKKWVLSRQREYMEVDRTFRDLVDFLQPMDINPVDKIAKLKALRDAMENLRIGLGLPDKVLPESRKVA